jgi:hypothetical protein
MPDIGARRRDSFTNHINLRGSPTTVNGHTINALWQDAQAQRVQLFLDENLWHIPSFEVRFPAAVLDAPYSLKNGMEMTRTLTNWRAVVRNITVEESNGSIISVNALAVNTTE